MQTTDEGEYYQITQEVFKNPSFMSVADTTRNEPHVPRDEKGKFTSAHTDADHAPGALAPLGNTEMKNILKHIGTCLCAAFVCHFEARVVKLHAG